MPARVAGSGMHAELALEHRSAVVVGTHRTGPVAQVSLQQHQVPVADFLQWLQLDPAPGRRAPPPQVTGSRPRGTEQIAQVHALTVEL